jgi:hypothetical protein
MRPLSPEFRSIDDLLDVVLMEMGANHPGLSSAEESTFKNALLTIMADDEGWRRDPWEMMRRFEAILEGFNVTGTVAVPGAQASTDMRTARK